MTLRICLLLTILACLTFTPAAETNNFESTPVVENPSSAPVPDTLASTSSFYTFRRDLRRCASPRCGGYFVKLVNERRTRCADYRFQAECYVASIDWNGETEPDNDRGLLRGTIRPGRDQNRGFGVFHATEVWRAAGANQAAGIFFRVRDRGIRCIAAPCPTHHEARLNSTVSRNIAGVDLSGAGAPDNSVSDANAAMTGRDEIIVSGDHSPVSGPAGHSQMLKAAQFYLRAGKTTSSPKPCMKTGCSGQVCSDKEVITTCEFRAEYECYKKAACERQANGDCGWTQTSELTACLRRAR